MSNEPTKQARAGVNWRRVLPRAGAFLFVVAVSIGIYLLRGSIEPVECPLFGKVCRSQHPLGACMVSSEGACAAYYQYEGAGI